MLPVHLPLLRTNGGTEGVHKSGPSSGSASKNAKYSSYSIPRRLVLSKSNKEASFNRQREGPQSAFKTRFPDKSGQICSGAKSVSSLYRGKFSIGNRNSVPYSGENNKNQRSLSESERRFSSTGLSSSTRPHGILHRAGSQCSTLHATNTTASASILKASNNVITNENSFQETIRKSPSVLAKKGNLLNGCSFSPQRSSKIITTDASKIGYGGHMENQLLQGTWSVQDKMRHINQLEMKAVMLTVQHFLPQLRGHTVLIRSDNTTVVQCINKQGSTKSVQMCYQTWDLWHLALKNQIILKAAHLAGSRNILADNLSRVKILPTEWSLNDAVAHRVFQIWGQPLVDLFASEMNQKTAVFCTWIPSQLALATDALSIAWENMEAYAFPPICLIPKVIQHMKNFSCQIILIAPQWPRRPWYTSLLQMSIACLMKLPIVQDLLTQPKTQICHPNPQIFRLAAWLLSTDPCKIKVFQLTLESSVASWRAGTRKDYAVKFKKFNSWCSEREIDPYDANVTNCADFLTSLYQDGLKYRTILGYRSMLSVLLPSVEGVQIGQHPGISRLLKGVFNSWPPVKRLVPEWDLRKVLDMLSKSPLEPMNKISLKYLTWKTVFLAAVSTFRRCGDIQALRIDSGFMSIVQEGIIFIREGLSKQDRPGHSCKKILVPCFRKNSKVDPKRAVESYLKKTAVLRQNSGSEVNQLFISINKPHKAVSKQTVSSWIVGVIKLAYEDSEMNVKAHSTRAIGPSWALFNGASITSILEAADWSSDTTFKKFYYRELESQDWEF